MNWFRMLRSQRGLGLTEVIMGGGLLALIGVGISKLMSSNMSASNKLSSSLDLSAVRKHLIDALDCAESFPATPPCASGAYVPLKAKNGSTVVDAGGTVFGKWVVRARCTGTGIDVRAASPTTANLSNPAVRNFASTSPAFFRPDEMNASLRYDWNHPKGMIFPLTGSDSLCSHLFGAVPPPVTCSSPNQYVKAVNFATKSVVCEDLPVMECNTGVRFKGGPVSGSGVSAYNSGNKWGMTCDAPYVRTGCFITNSASADGTTMGTPPQYADWDVVPVVQGCYTDDEERAHNTWLTIVCCKI